jgi:pimeloyl-ACP methyl ester carboxylesterase
MIYGQDDPAIHPLDNERVAASSTLVHQLILQGSGHFPMLDESASFNRLMLDFLALDSGDSPRELMLKGEWKRRVR